MNSFIAEMRMSSFVFVVGLAACPALADQDYAWVQLSEEATEPGVTQAIIRAVTTSECTDISPTGLTMTERPNSQVTHMAGRKVCEATVKLDAEQKITVAGLDLIVPSVDSPSRILLLGDTGCREAPAGTQDCTSDWYFKEIATASAALAPDLVIHVGDYTYRDNCGRNLEGCTNEPDPDKRALRSWTVWEDDFFAPAAPLLAQAPWIIVRGNHEDCDQGVDRGWVGWSAFFSTAGPVGTLEDCERDLYKVDEMISFQGGRYPALQIYMLNASRATTTRLVDFSRVTNTPETWITTHVPFWSDYKTFRDHRDSYHRAWPDASMVLSGHDHLFEINQVAQDGGQSAPIQVIQGASGTMLQNAHQGGPDYNGFRYVNEGDFSVNMLERTVAGQTNMTLCVFSRSSFDFSAEQTWTIVQSDDGPVIKDADAVSDTACKAPS